MQSFDVATLRVFLAVARLGSIGAAARSEHIAASAASRRISDLERELDTVLITRTPHGASLTAAGKAFAEHGEKLLNQFAEVRSDLKKFADGEAGDLRIAAAPWAMNGSLPAKIAQFKKENPTVNVSVQEIYSRKGNRFLREDLADLAIVYDNVDLHGFEQNHYKTDHAWIIGNGGHPLFEDHQGADPIYFKDTLDYEQISFFEGGVLDELVTAASRREGRTTKNVIKVLRVDSLLRCVEAGLGLGVIGERDFKKLIDRRDIKGLPLADEWALRNLVCVYPKGQTASPTVRRFLQYISARK